MSLESKVISGWLEAVAVVGEVFITTEGESNRVESSVVYGA